MLRLLFQIVLVLGISAIAACGFHLRGSSEVAAQYNPIYIEPADLQRSQIELIRNALLKSSAVLSDEPKANRLRVKFSKEKPRRVASSNLTDIDLVRLTLRMDFSLQSADGSMLIEPQQLVHNAELELDSANVLSHDSLIKERFDALQRSLVRTMNYRLTR